jgi:hypothetical protein
MTIETVDFPVLLRCRRVFILRRWLGQFLLRLALTVYGVEMDTSL